MAADYKSLLKEFEALNTRRKVYERDWQDIIDLVRPMTSDITKRQYEGTRRADQIFDSTAPEAVEQLASGLHSYLTNPTERWFTLTIPGYDDLPDDYEAMSWLEKVSDIIYTCYQDERSNFNTTLHEGYMDLSSFGNIIIYQEAGENNEYISFQGFPLVDCWYAENARGMIDRMFRRAMLTSNKVRQLFEVIPPKLQKLMDQDDSANRPNKEYEVIHCVTPRVSKTDNRYKGTMRFESCWICRDTQEIIEEGGYRTFPYHCSRWIKLPKEPYGRGPAHKCLPDIKMLNKMEFILIKAAQKIVDPALMVPNDGFLLPITTSPGGLIFKEPGTEPIVPLETKGQIQLGLDQSDRKRNQIKQGFYADWLRMEKDNKEMTAYEVADRRDEKLRLMAPMLGRQQSELLGPCIARSYDIATEMNRIPTAPLSLRGKALAVAYVSPAARAQSGSKANDMSRYVQDITPLAQIAPTIMDSIDTDEYAAQMALARGLTRKILRAPKDVAAMRDARNQQQQAQQVAQTAEPMSNALKNVADAQSKGLQL